MNSGAVSACVAEVQILGLGFTSIEGNVELCWSSVLQLKEMEALVHTDRMSSKKSPELSAVQPKGSPKRIQG